MRSSTVNFLRGLTMLSCLIALPAVAVFGLPMPDRVTSILERFGLFEEEETTVAAAPEEPPGVLGDAVYGENPAPISKTNLTCVPTFDRNVVPASAEEPLGVSATESPSQGAGFFRGIQERLRQLGATYYRLESWGEHGELFHFQCRVAVDGHVNFTRHFEATGDDPLTAMDSVLTEIEAWKERRGPMETGSYSP